MGFNFNYLPDSSSSPPSNGGDTPDSDSPPPEHQLNSPFEPIIETYYTSSEEPYFSDFNFLTSYAGVPSSGTQSPSSGVYSGNSQNSSPSGPIYSPQASTWASLPVSSSYSQNLMNPGGLMQSNYGRSSTYSSASPAYPRSSQSPADGLPAPFESGSPAYSLPVPGSGAGYSNLLSQPSNQTALQNPMMTSHSQGSHPSTPSTTAAPDSYARSQSGSSYYSAPSSSTAHQSSFPSFTSTHASSSQTSPTTAGALPRSLTAHHSPMQAPPYPGQYPYSGGPVLTNMTNPGGRMRIVGPMLSGHHYQPQGQLMGAHSMYSRQTVQQQERPFKCDECPTQFNRNHDLKRHKKIHLAIKPFPCTFCDKSFSRKDALKRHRLVKGCGGGTDSPGDGNNKSPSDDPNVGPTDPPSSELIKEEPA
ncbi:uncharacterized protein GGS22DRAFT_187203 [Annulohypoxylon maeteangense]|uniref:uncharacterized protein n=1 Tax=Annulohypoxylon maeteangense TaxID=1927788 RepID=UPI002008B6AB|nr:uncharacterized protein GGS22DRAFT_187203 [Annulohypoxylon maeteangense]KAI0885972.1 hypothetical protein GGS22DRAFT_187203 [Annulohypoxylon maeteangense]